jgi:hypothetical protein
MERNDMPTRRRFRAAIIWLSLVTGLMVPALASCQRDKGDPVAIAREFIISLWTGDVDQVKNLACENRDWRAAILAEAEAADPAVTVDPDHLRFDAVSESELQVEIAMSGVVTFKSADGLTEVRDLDAMGAIHFTLIDESGWKVCAVR